MIKDESKWSDALKAAAEQNKAHDYAYVMGIYKNIGGEMKKKVKEKKVPMVANENKMKFVKSELAIRAGNLLIKAKGKDYGKGKRKQLVMVTRNGKTFQRLQEVGVSAKSLQTYALGFNALREKVKRQAPGKGKEIKLTHDEIKTVLQKMNVGVVSAGRNPKDPKDMAMSDAQIEARYGKLKKDLIAKGYQFVEGEGKYEGLTEKSLIVMMPDADEKDVVELGKKYNQDSVIFSEKNINKMIYTVGENAGKFYKGEGFEEKSPDTSDFYTQIGLAGNKTMKFLMNFNFDKLEKSIRGFVNRIGALLK
jgi:hypothetical protein